MRFRTKPFEIEAVQFTGDNFEEVKFEFHDDPRFEFWPVDEDERVDDPEIVASVFDELHSTWVGVKAGQWIIKGMKGEYYPCDPEVFESKYEAIKGDWWKK